MFNPSRLSPPSFKQFTPVIQRHLVSFAVALLAGMVVVQGFLAVEGHRITLRTQLALGVVAVGYVAFFMTRYLELRRVRFALLSAHLIGYVIVNGSYWVHASYLWVTGQGNRVDSGWYGLLFGMSICWGAALAGHVWLVVHRHGFEDAAVA